jgi:hypothetical protein
MATFLDIAFLDKFSSIFVVLFVFVLVYAVLTFKGAFGGNKGVSALLAFSVGFIFLFAPDAIEILKRTVPWMVLGLIGMVFIILLMQATGVGADVWSIMSPGKQRSVVTWVIIYFFVDFLFAGSSVIGQKAGPYLGSNSTNSISRSTAVLGAGGSVASGSFQENLGATLFHPKVLGVILILVIALFTALWLGSVST